MKRADKISIFGRYIRIPGGNASKPFYIRLNNQWMMACYYFHTDGKFLVIDRIVFVNKEGDVNVENIRPKILVKRTLLSRMKAKHDMKNYLRKELSHE